MFLAICLHQRTTDHRTGILCHWWSHWIQHRWHEQQDLPQEHVLAGLRQHRRHRMFIRSSRLRKINGQILKTRISFMFMLNNIKIKVS